MRSIIILRVIVLVALGVGVVVTAAKPAAAADDKKGLELIARASKAYDAGAYTDASNSIDEAFKVGLGNDLAARAILLRAQINEKSGKLARALQDYSNALWMENLPASERKKAQDGKDRMIAAMGLGTTTAAAAKSTGSTAQPQVAPAASAQQNSSGGLFGAFTGLFSSSDEKKPEAAQAGGAQAPSAGWQTTAAPAAAPATTPKKVATVASVQPATATKASYKAKPSLAAASTPTSTASLQPASIGSSAGGTGNFLISFGSVSTQAAGQSKAQQIKTQLADILVNRELLVQASAAGGFQIVAGPYKAKSAAAALCGAIKQRGVGCQVTP